MISSDQHSFVKGLYTLIFLVSFTQYIADNIDNRMQTDFVYRYFSKAFDILDEIFKNKPIGYG